MNEKKITLFRQKHIGFIFQSYNLFRITSYNVCYTKLLRQQFEAYGLAISSVIVENGLAVGQEAETEVSDILKQSSFSITIDLGQGKAEETVYT